MIVVSGNSVPEDWLNADGEANGVVACSTSGQSAKAEIEVG